MKAIGQTQFLAFKKGKHLSWKGLVLAKCYECMNQYIDGRMDCNVRTCPCYQEMPYRSKIDGNVPIPPKSEGTSNLSESKTK